MKTVNVLLAVLVSILIALSVFEGGLRLSPFAPSETGNRFDAELGWSKRPDTTITRSSLEFRARSSVAKQRNIVWHLRIVLFL